MDEGWDHCVFIRTETEMRALAAMEQAIDPMPAWAREIAEGAISFPPFCPHWSFPKPYLEIVAAIGHEQPPAFLHGCYTASRSRKDLLQDYLRCLDAWLSGCTASQAAQSIRAGAVGHPVWPQVCDSLWSVLGSHTAVKDLLIARILHRQRWWLQSLIWDDDAGDVYCQDQYLGDRTVADSQSCHYGHAGFNDPYCAELRIPLVVNLEKHLAAVCPDWREFKKLIRESWLCAPKAFRFLERLLWYVGREKVRLEMPAGQPALDEKIPDYLQCQGTYPDTTEIRSWLNQFENDLRTWLLTDQPQKDTGLGVHQLLGAHSPVKLWLVSLFLLKMRALNPCGAMMPLDM